VAGNFRNPLVGRDVLLGVLFGLLGAATLLSAEALPYWFDVNGVSPYFPTTRYLDPNLRGVGSFLSQFGWSPVDAVSNALGSLAILFVLSKVLRNKIAALGIVMLLWTAINLTENPLRMIAFPFVVAVFMAISLTRVGLLSLVIWYAIFNIVLRNPLTTDLPHGTRPGPRRRCW
jgi:hypothetical protein